LVYVYVVSEAHRRSMSTESFDIAWLRYT
jgi:hypothetical protein